ncbi:SMI1/KNR4 family protein [Listeria booriae]|uniref:SMI1/KNR4 family protein n=1 Tax=Listeria booriae TaxID=1552123 RepID=A0A842EY19_9LIST|nr:SMI1/KNR4 family protein [Listeria booriae]MBC2241408.1 SMI1/KNR4 family protein [Listeria booriae]
MVSIESSNKKATSAAIEDFEQRYNLKLAEDYKKFLLDFNGGYADPNVFKISEEQGESVLNTLYGLGIDDEYDELESVYESLDGIIPSDFISIADDSGGNQICLGVDDDYFGKVFVWIHDMEIEEDMDNMFLLADDFKLFLDNLYVE